METILVGLKNEKAKKLLKDLEDLNLIELLEKGDTKINLSELKDNIVSKMSEAEIDNQLQSIREEWQRDI
ncbi:MAG TPA: hypothetical protein VHB70_01460 [Parafilimonas sp.]|nr:hypothetical protein [Parafilimonas sp.]